MLTPEEEARIREEQLAALGTTPVQVVPQQPVPEQQVVQPPQPVQPEPAQPVQPVPQQAPAVDYSKESTLGLASQSTDAQFAALKQQEQANIAEAAAKEEAMRRRQAIEADVLQKTEAIRAERERVVSAEREKRASLEQDIANTVPDPKRYYTNAGGWEKALTIFGAALAGYINPDTSKNGFLQLIERNIDRDLQMQRDALEGKKSALKFKNRDIEELLAKYDGDIDFVQNVQKVSMLNQAASYFEQQVARSVLPQQQKAKLMEGVAQVYNQAANIKQQHDAYRAQRADAAFSKGIQLEQLQMQREQRDAAQRAAEIEFRTKQEEKEYQRALDMADRGLVGGTYAAGPNKGKPVLTSKETAQSLVKNRAQMSMLAGDLEAMINFRKQHGLSDTAKLTSFLQDNADARAQWKQLKANASNSYKNAKEMGALAQFELVITQDATGQATDLLGEYMNSTAGMEQMRAKVDEEWQQTVQSKVGAPVANFDLIVLGKQPPKTDTTTPDAQDLRKAVNQDNVLDYLKTSVKKNVAPIAGIKNEKTEIDYATVDVLLKQAKKKDEDLSTKIESAPKEQKATLRKERAELAKYVGLLEKRRDAAKAVDKFAGTDKEPLGDLLKAGMRGK